ncbi:MAG: sensor histidine kinase [Candidatus Acidiferrales bacterium]
MPWIEFALALCVLVAVAVASDSVTSRLADAQYWVVHTHEVETATAQTRADFVAAGDARQIFIITSDTAALTDYNRAKAAIPAELANLQKLTEDNPTQQANIRELRQVVGQRLGLLEQSINLRENSGFDTEQQKQLTRDSVALKDQTLTILNRMKAEEDRLMAVRQTISARNYRHVRIVLIASFAVVVLLLTINFYDLARELKEHRQAEEAVQKLSSRILRVQDEERRRVARELHDSIGQVFAVLKMNLEMISRTFTTSDPQQVRQLLAESKTALEIGLSGARTLSHLLHPPLLDEMGFVSAAKWLVEGFSRRSKIQVKLEVTESLPRMEQDVELALFRILQEALTNIHKHSESPSVDICVRIDESKVSLRIRDYGRGIPASVIDTFKRSQAGLGVGLAGMRERIRDLGGRLELKSDGKGSVVEASVPFRLAPEPQDAKVVPGGSFTPEQHG